MVAIGWRQAAPKMIFAITVCPDHPPANDAGPCLWVSVSVTRPIAAGTHSWEKRRRHEAGRLIDAEHQIGVLERLSRGTLAQIVKDRDAQRAPGNTVADNAEMAEVRSMYMGEGRPFAERQNKDEGFIGIGIRQPSTTLRK